MGIYGDTKIEDEGASVSGVPVKVRKPVNPNYLEVLVIDGQGNVDIQRMGTHDQAWQFYLENQGTGVGRTTARVVVAPLTGAVRLSWWRTFNELDALCAKHGFRIQRLDEWFKTRNLPPASRPSFKIELLPGDSEIRRRREVNHSEWMDREATRMKASMTAAQVALAAVASGNVKPSETPAELMAEMRKMREELDQLRAERKAKEDVSSPPAADADDEPAQRRRRGP